MSDPARERGPVIALMGPTAAGKTGIAIALVERFNMEIVSVDSAMVYRGMDIGTAKPSADELARAPHRLIDVCDPTDAYSAGRFRRDALAAIGEIHAAGRVPLLTGGTMLYFRALFAGLDELPEGDPQIRSAIDERASRLGWPALHAELRRVDPDAAARIHPNDSQRIQRALEVYERSGIAISDWQARSGGDRFPYRLLRIALIPAQRAILHERIEARLQAMLAAGFVDEVRSLCAKHDLQPGAGAMRAVGYRQIGEYLQGAVSLEEAVRRATTATRRLAKRQLTWLRKEPQLSVIDPTAADAMAKIVARVAKWGGHAPHWLC